MKVEDLDIGAETPALKAAKQGDMSLLREKILGGRPLTRLEREAVASILVGKFKKSRGRPKSEEVHKRRRRMWTLFVSMGGEQHGQGEAAYNALQKRYGLDRSTVINDIQAFKKSLEGRAAVAARHIWSAIGR